MDAFGIDIGHIVELGTQVAAHGALRLGEVLDDELWEYVIGIAIVIYEMDPG